jgi:hypothetical protein
LSKSHHLSPSLQTVSMLSQIRIVTPRRRIHLLRRILQLGSLHLMILWARLSLPRAHSSRSQPLREKVVCIWNINNHKDVQSRIHLIGHKGYSKKHPWMLFQPQVSIVITSCLQINSEAVVSSKTAIPESQTIKANLWSAIGKALRRIVTKAL